LSFEFTFGFHMAEYAMGNNQSMVDVVDASGPSISEDYQGLYETFVLQK
jgi:hypothetical protein